MGMEDFALLVGFAAIAIFGYLIMASLDRFLDKVRQENEEREQAVCFNIATSCANAIPVVSNILNEIHQLYPDVHCNLSLGYERNVIQSLDRGDADVVIISADSDVESETPVQWNCITLNPQSFSIGDGALELETLESVPQ